MFRTGPHIRKVTALFAATLLVTAACGGGGGGDSAKADVASISVGDGNDQQSSPDGEGTAEAPANSEDAFALYDECMTKAGFEFETIPFDGEEGDGLETLSPDAEEDDPQAGGSLNDFDPEAFEKANSTCEVHISNIDSGFDLSPEQEAAVDDANLKWEECMEQQGVDLPDTEASDGFDVDSPDAADNPQEGGTADDQDFDFESFNEAAENCQQIFDDIPGFSEQEAGR